MIAILVLQLFHRSLLSFSYIIAPIAHLRDLCWFFWLLETDECYSGKMYDLMFFLSLTKSVFFFSFPLGSQWRAKLLY